MATGRGVPKHLLELNVSCGFHFRVGLCNLHGRGGSEDIAQVFSEISGPNFLFQKQNILQFYCSFHYIQVANIGWLRIYVGVGLHNYRSFGCLIGFLIFISLSFWNQFPIPQIICTSIIMILSLYPSSEYWLAANLFPSRIT